MEKPYFLEPTLPKRIKEYIKEHGNKKVDMETLTDHLIANNKEFNKKKKKIFIKGVTKAYNYVVLSDMEQDIELVVENEDIYEVPVVPAEEMKEGFTIDAMYKSSPTLGPIRLTSPKISSKANGHAEINGNAASESPIAKVLKMKRKRIPIIDNDVKIISPVSKKKKKKFETNIPDCSLSNMEGLESLMEDIADLGATNLIAANVQIKKHICKSVLLNGPEGSGKSMLVSSLAGDFKAHLLKISAGDFIPGNGKPASGEEVFDSIFKEALAHSPCILHIENLHILPRDTGLNKSPDSKLITHLIDKIKDINTNHSDQAILIFGEIKYQYSQNMDVSLRNIFQTELFIPSLCKGARFNLLKKLCPNLKIEELEDIAFKTPSYFAGDLIKLVKKADILSRKRYNKHLIVPSSAFQTLKNCTDSYTMEYNIKKEDLDTAIKMMTPALKREGFPFIPEVKMSEVGGMEDVKSEIKKKILVPIQQPELYKMYGKQALYGILLYGPPGCGKTLLAKAIANEAGLNFLPVNSGEMLKMYQGESERAIRDNFRLAASVKPCIIFFDEFDCISATRIGGAETGSRQSIVNTLLNEMDGIVNRDGVYIMACTNRPDVIDAALLRPGRLDTKLYVGLPDETGRTGILEAAIKNGPCIASDVSLAKISNKCENFTGADLVYLINIARERAIERDIERKEEGKTIEVSGLTKDDFEYACKNVYPSVSQKDLKYYTKLKNTLEASMGPKVGGLEKQENALDQTNSFFEANKKSKI